MEELLETKELQRECPRGCMDMYGSAIRLAGLDYQENPVKIKVLKDKLREFNAIMKGHLVALYKGKVIDFPGGDWRVFGADMSKLRRTFEGKMFLTIKSKKKALQYHFDHLQVAYFKTLAINAKMSHLGLDFDSAKEYLFNPNWLEMQLQVFGLSNHISIDYIRGQAKAGKFERFSTQAQGASI